MTAATRPPEGRAIRTFTVAEARALLPEVLDRAHELIPLRADLAEGAARQREGGDVALAELKAGEARLSEILDWFPEQGIQVKGWAPLLIDFPHRAAGRDVLLCWLEGETTLDWYHDVAHGFAGRRRLDDLP